jgi:hypothetical protein
VTCPGCVVLRALVKQLSQRLHLELEHNGSWQDCQREPCKGCREQAEHKE